MKATITPITLSVFYRSTGLLFMSIVAILFIPELYAQTPVNSAVGNMICYIADNFQGNAGRGIATIGLSVLGTLALLGRVTWTQAIVIGVGCAVLFGAPMVAVSLGANGTCP